MGWNLSVDKQAICLRITNVDALHPLNSLIQGGADPRFLGISHSYETLPMFAKMHLFFKHQVLERKM